jgi:hypothetical protein
MGTHGVSWLGKHVLNRRIHATRWMKVAHMMQAGSPARHDRAYRHENDAKKIHPT